MAQNDNNGGNLGFEAELFKAADKLRGNMEPSDYKHIALGLVFLKYISDAFEARHAELLAEDGAAAEDKDEYLADNIFWVPREARWSHLRANAKQSSIGMSIDEAMRTIEKDAGNYADIPGFCKSATLEEIRKHGHVLTPGRYVGAAEQEDDGEPFTEKMQRLAALWRGQQAEAAELDAAIEANLKELGYDA